MKLRASHVLLWTGSCSSVSIHTWRRKRRASEGRMEKRKVGRRGEGGEGASYGREGGREKGEDKTVGLS